MKKKLKEIADKDDMRKVFKCVDLIAIYNIGIRCNIATLTRFIASKEKKERRSMKPIAKIE
jgi:hypothetical protein